VSFISPLLSRNVLKIRECGETIADTNGLIMQFIKQN